MTEPTLTHVDASGRARMVDVGDKEVTRRSATASGRVRMSSVALALVREGSANAGWLDGGLIYSPPAR
jgi:cyclic pyranopterin phosphate synthase